MEEKKEDKVIQVVTTDKIMHQLLPDGTKIPVSGKVIDTFYASGRKDCKIKLSPMGG